MIIKPVPNKTDNINLIVPQRRQNLTGKLHMKFFDIFLMLDMHMLISQFYTGNGIRTQSGVTAYEKKNRNLYYLFFYPKVVKLVLNVLILCSEVFKSMQF